MTPADAAKYWEIVPEPYAGSKVLQFPAAATASTQDSGVLVSEKIGPPSLMSFLKLR